MPAYMVVHAVITDPARFIEYAKGAEVLATKFGATYLVRGGHNAVLEGHWPHNRRTVISRWPSIETIKDFWESPEYAELKALRDGAANCDIAIYEGVSI